MLFGLIIFPSPSKGIARATIFSVILKVCNTYVCNDFFSNLEDQKDVSVKTVLLTDCTYSGNIFADCMGAVEIIIASKNKNGKLK